MEEVEQPSGPSGERQTRTAQACQRCRSLKTRCLPSERAGTCQRCFQAKRDCTWAEIPRKARRARGPSRISQVEQKIDGLVATLVNSDVARPAAEPGPLQSTQPPSHGSGTVALPAHTRSSVPGRWHPVASSSEQPSESDQEQRSEQDRRFAERIRQIHHFGDDESDLTRPPGSMFSTAARDEAPIQGDLVQELLSSGEADNLLNEYRSMTESYPFVPVPSHVTARELSSSKPMVFLAILTVSSWKNHARQRSLDEKYRVELANRTIIHPRRTLSLLQSMLVYLAWYHFLFSHQTQQIYSLLQLAVGLAMDLGLYQEHKRGLPVLGRQRFRPPSPEEQRDRQRAFLGCYYLSSAIAMAMMKPNLLKYTEYMGKCGRNLYVNHEFESDKIIMRLISLRRIDDQIHDSFDVEDAANLPITDSRVSMNLRFIETQLEEWKRDKNEADCESRVLDLCHAFTDMQLHAVSLRPAPLELHHQGVSNTTQLNSLLATLEAGKRFLDTLVAFPTSLYHTISFAEWIRFPHVVVTVSRLCLSNESLATLQWDAKAAQDRVRLDLYLESLCYRMQGLSTYDGRTQKMLDFWQVMHMIMDLTRGWYARRVQGINNNGKKGTRSGGRRSQHATPGESMPTPETMEGFGQCTAVTDQVPPKMQGFQIGNVVPQGSSTGDFSGEYVSGVEYMDAGGMPMGDMGGDPFAFMRDMDIDMDAFLDMGIWGTESYEGMGFGGGNMGM
ncbi:uncharacterized protein EI97DRAFT_469018 [Westerdykella ornata]|uniref:Zn(2)-C6 fungal-type domain-containing protein n=1 Tax=Westerdykella ornata TaxID=318751 RepID=A0A6A6JCP3_WESOR|nr:uncharacterized protein EI97DRAFT_469018 [Westerdykella ornata]KAF2274045.1 hypothetical protein EI97DRAFT_469018 [Westerdykella ornata]